MANESTSFALDLPLQLAPLSSAPPLSPPSQCRIYLNASTGLMVSTNGGAYQALGTGAGGPPTGAAGGALSGSYPNPDLANVGPGATGPIGDATHSPIITINAKGQVTVLTSAVITGVTPNAHANSHAAAGSDPVTPAAIAALSVANNLSDVATILTALSNLLAGIDSLTAKTTLVDADEAILADSAASFAGKKITFANVKAALKAYFDTLYSSVTLESILADCATTASSKVPAGSYTAGVYLATATGAVTIDGFALALGSRVLDKDNTTTANQGEWVVTIAGADGVALSMIRAQDMNQANEFYGALVEVIQGTVNSGTFWRETAVVTTVNTDAVAFSQMVIRIPANNVTNAMLAQAAAKTVKGNPTTGTADETDTTDPVVSGAMTAADFVATGLTGATAASRYVGATASGAPASGTFAVGDFVIDQTGTIWVCAGAGTPGTWAQSGLKIGTTSTTVAAGNDSRFTQEPINVQSGTTYTLAATDIATCVEFSSGSAITLTFPQDSAVTIPVNSIGSILPTGAGAVTFAAGSGATIQVQGGKTKTNEQYGPVFWKKRAANTFVITGDVA
jgi:hypothetical protein